MSFVSCEDHKSLFIIHCPPIYLQVMTKVAVESLAPIKILLLNWRSFSILKYTKAEEKSLFRKLEKHSIK